MFRALILAALEIFPWLPDPETVIPPSEGDGDNRSSIDPNG